MNITSGQQIHLRIPANGQPKEYKCYFDSFTHEKAFRWSDGVARQGKYISVFINKSKIALLSENHSAQFEELMEGEQFKFFVKGTRWSFTAFFHGIEYNKSFTNKDGTTSHGDYVKVWMNAEKVQLSE